MRILQLSSYHERVGGAEVYMRHLSDDLARRGHDIAHFASDPARAIDEPRLRVLQRVEYAPDKLVRDPLATGALADFLQRVRPELVHLHNFHTFPLEILLTLSAQAVPVVHTVHDFSVLCPNSWNVRGDGSVCGGGAGAQCFEHGCTQNYPYDGRAVFVTGLRAALLRQLVDDLIAPSPFLGRLLRQHGFAPVHDLPYYVARGEHGRAPATTASAASSRVLFAGRLVPEKGVDVLLRAMPGVLGRFPTARLDVLGGGPEEPRLKALALELGLASAVEFLGPVPHARMRGHLEAAAVQVFPSIWCENSPLGCYEAMAAGVPMVASRIAGLPSLVVDGETGLLAPPRDPRALGDCIARVLEDPSLRARLAQGARAAADRLSVDEHLDRVERIYADALARGPRPRSSEFAAPDYIASTDALMLQLHGVERWALDMKAHIGFLESRATPALRFRSRVAKTLRAWRRKREA